MTTILEVASLRKTFGAFVAIDDVSIEVSRGSIHGVIGPNGAGKSTLLGLICGRYRADLGEVILDGRRITRFHDYQRVKLGIGIKFQLTRVLPDLSVWDNLRVAHRTVRHDSSRRSAVDIEEVLDVIGMGDSRRLSARELSHGERKWLEIGAVLLTRPRVLILDEPTSAMSVGETVRCADLIRSLIDSNRVDAIVLVEHDTKFIASLCDQITVLHHGKVLAEGTFEDVRTSSSVREAYLGGVDV